VVEPPGAEEKTSPEHSQKKQLDVVDWETTPQPDKPSTVVMVGPNFRVGQRIGRGNFGEVRIGNIYTVYLCFCIFSFMGHVS